MQRTVVCVLFGGRGAEHEVSRRSCAEVLSHMDREKYEIVCVGITKEGKWLLYDGEYSDIESGAWQGGKTTPVTLDLSSGCLLVLGKTVKTIYPHIYFPILHGDYGEDGRLQGIFEIAGVRYVGCGAYSSHICMDKALTKSVAAGLGIPLARGCVIRARDMAQGAESRLEIIRQIQEGGSNGLKALRYPLFVKPCMSGSSVGAQKVKEAERLHGAISNALKYSEAALVEEFIDGYEAEVGVMEMGNDLIVSPVGMIKYKKEFYDYDAKYRSEGNEYLIPAPFDEGVSEKIRGYAKLLFRALSCSGLGRFDFFVKKDGGAVFNEVNTLPGFTRDSMFPKLFMHMGLSYGEIIDRLLQGAKTML